MTNNPKLPLIEQKTALYNRLSKEIENCNYIIKYPHGYTPGIVSTAIKYRPIFRATQRLLDSIFRGEEE